MRHFTQSDTERTGPHRRVEGLLDQLGISYMSEAGFPPYRADIYLPEWHLAIEIDGPLHSKKKDQVRDQYLLEWYGLYTLRINSMKWKGANKLKEIIVQFIEDYCAESEERKALWQSRIAL